DVDEAVEYVATAVREAAAAGMRQTVASAGVEILELVERLAWSVAAEWRAGVRRLGAVSPAERGSASRIAALSPRERDVLRMLPSRLTIAEVAAELNVSVNTVKYHIKSIYRKLGVSSRAEAADAARMVA